MRLENRVAIITGAAGGIGRATVKRFVEEGARVVAVDIDEGKLETVTEDIPQSEKYVLKLKIDVTNENECKRMVQQTIEEYGHLDILFNNVGLNHSAKIHETEAEDWDRVMDVNVKSMFLCSKYAIPELKKAGRGSIINTASPGGVVGLPGLAAYCASKGAVISLTKNMAIDYADDNIRVNYICPGVIMTEMTEQVINSKENPEEFRAWYETARPLGRFGEPEEIANAALFLASDESSFVTGTSIIADGGFIAK